MSKVDHRGLEKMDRCEKDARKRGERESGEPVNWTPACISSPLDQLSGAIKTPDMHTEGRGLKEVMAEQEAVVLLSHACDDGSGEIQKDRRGKRGKVGQRGEC